MVVESYAKLNPGEITYHSIDDKHIDFKIANQNLKIRDEGNIVQLSWNNKKYDVLFQSTESENQKIYMPWIQEGKGILLKSGAFVLKG